MKKSANETIA